MESKIGIVKLSRKQLYDEIWLLSVAGVARKYNLNYGRLIGSCKEEKELDRVFARRSWGW
jgi:hypothetical protein